MIRPFAFAGKFALFIAIMAVLAGMSLLMVGVYLASWPIMRISPRNRKVQSLVGLAVAGMAVARAYELDKFSPPATEDTEDTDTETGVEGEDEDIERLRILARAFAKVPLSQQASAMQQVTDEDSGRG